MDIKFTKMHGLGNDFMVLDGINQTIKLSADQIKHYADRKTGVGFDQCLIIEPSAQESIDFNYRIFNADGQEVGQCGNGARCLALFAQYYGLTKKPNLRVATNTTQMNLQINPDQSVTVDMGQPKLNPNDIPFLAAHQTDEYQLSFVDGTATSVHAISVGNPHAVRVVTDVNSAPVQSLGHEISHHPLFPEQTNAGFMQILNPAHIKLRVYERGCGETSACGSGAVAAAAIGRLFYGLSEQITVSLTGGELRVDWPRINGPITLTGPATFVYEGRLLF